MDTVIDDDSYEKVKHWVWRLNKYGYVSRREKDKRIFLHREIMQTPEGYITDHINGNKLDNLKSNLRVATDRENVWNQGIRSDNSSGYRGVYFRKDRKRWSAEIKKDGKKYALGCYSSAEMAAKAYNTKAKELFGEYARLNSIKKSG